MSGDKMGGPALPITTSSHIHENGMTLREYAAIHLKVPNSGNPELDEMIDKSVWRDYAAAAMSGLIPLDTEYENRSPSGTAREASEYADAMLAERAKRSES